MILSKLQGLFTTMVRQMTPPSGQALGVRPLRVVSDYQDEYVPANGYSYQTNRILGTTIDEVETKLDLETYEKMEADSQITKSTKIIITNVLADELQFAPGASEIEISAREYELYVWVMNFCDRTVKNLRDPFRETLEQFLRNGIRYGHGVAEITWEEVIDKPDELGKSNTRNRKSRIGAFWDNVKIWAGYSGDYTMADGDDAPGVAERPALQGPKLRLLPKTIKVKPRGACHFVVDDYMNVLGFVPKVNSLQSKVKYNEVISRDKFMVLTINKKDEDPRGTSSYRPSVNWWNIKTQIPIELMRTVLEEASSKAVLTMPETPQAWEVERDANGAVVYQDDAGREPSLVTPIESAQKLIESFRSGSGAVIPHGADLRPYKTNSAEADFFPKIISILNRQMEEGILLQSLAQSEGEHQARSAASVHSDLLHILIFWLRWILATVIMRDLLETTVRINLGDWALKYMPFVSLGDFVRRDWARDLEVVSKAYFYGFLDDTQRAELMAWLNLPNPGPSRQEVLAQMDSNGEPVMPNNNRPDKQGSNNRRNDGNGTEKQNDDNNKASVETNATVRRGPFNSLGYDRTSTAVASRYLRRSIK